MIKTNNEGKNECRVQPFHIFFHTYKIGTVVRMDSGDALGVARAKINEKGH